MLRNYRPDGRKTFIRVNKKAELLGQYEGLANTIKKSSPEDLIYEWSYSLQRWLKCGPFYATGADAQDLLNDKFIQDPFDAGQQRIAGVVSEFRQVEHAGMEPKSCGNGRRQYQTQNRG